MIAEPALKAAWANGDKAGLSPYGEDHSERSSPRRARVIERI